ncbi:mrvi1 protein [Mactra antiquata]
MFDIKQDYTSLSRKDRRLYWLYRHRSRVPYRTDREQYYKTGYPGYMSHLAAVRTMKKSDDSFSENHNEMKKNSNGLPVLIQGENKHSPVEPVQNTKSSNLSKIRESHLAKRRDRPSTMPQLSELSEKESADNNNEIKEPVTTVKDSTKENKIPQPETNGDVIMPTIPDEFLHKLGLTSTGKSSEELTDQEIESKFTSLSLAFKTDIQTLEKRLEIQERSRDIAEENVDKEIRGLRSGLETLNQICTDPQVREVLSKIQKHIDILEKSTARVSSRAEVFGAIQQEKRMSKAVDIMVHHVENIRRVHEREHAELEEARKLLQDSRSLTPSIDSSGGGELLSRRSASVCQNNMFSTKARRRVSEIALPKVLGGSGAASLHPSASMGSNLNTAHLESSTNTLHSNLDPDARSRLQAVIASTAMKSAVANTLRRASLEKQGNVQSVSPSNTPPQVSRDNSSDSGNKQANEIQENSKEKQKNMEEEAFKKGYEQGLRASLGQDLSSLREQQNHINESLGDIMDSIDNQTEEPKSLKEILTEHLNEKIPKFTISSWRIRITFSCFFIVMAIISIIMALSPVSMGSAVWLHHYGKPPV